MDLIDRDAVLHDVSTECSNAHEAKYYEAQVALTRAKRIICDAPAVNRWIPCSERLPENRERVLVCFRSGTVHIAVWYGDYDEKGAWKVTSQFPTKLYRTYTIPKWMPMPGAYKPPEKECDDDAEEESEP